MLPVFVSLTSGDVTPEVEAQMDAAGGVPILRGTAAAFGAIARLAWWERAARRATGRGPVPAGAGRLAGRRRRPGYGHDRRRLEPGSVAARPAARARADPGARIARAAARRRAPVVDRSPSRAATADARGRDRRGRALGWPVAVKLDAAGARPQDGRRRRRVELGDEAAAGGAARRPRRRPAPASRSDGVLVQPMARAGVELIVGARRDPQFGPLVLVGLGGVLAEVLDDVALRLAPIRPATPVEMLDELRGAGILRRRARPPRRRSPAVAELLVALGEAMVEHPDWREVDLNPVIAGRVGSASPSTP